MASGQSVDGLYLTYLLASNKLSRGEIYTCIAELLLGGVDTVRSESAEIFVGFLLMLSRSQHSLHFKHFVTSPRGS